MLQKVVKTIDSLRNVVYYDLCKLHNVVGGDNLNKLKELREKRDISQLKLASIIGVSQKTVSAWETGRRNPKPRELQKIEDVFGVAKEDIFFNLFSYKM